MTTMIINLLKFRFGLTSSLKLSLVINITVTDRVWKGFCVIREFEKYGHNNNLWAWICDPEPDPLPDPVIMMCMHTNI